MSVEVLTRTEAIRRNISSASNRLKDLNKQRLESPGEIEYLFISIYRVSFDTLDRKQLMQDIIFHLNNPDNVTSKVKLVHRFSTIYNNRILGLEVQNASIYGSKIQLAFDDFDKELARTIKKNDIIIIHRLNDRKLNKIDAVASIMGLGTHSPSGIKDGAVTAGITSSLKDKFTGEIDRRLNALTDDFLTKEKPIFSGLITRPSLVMGSSIKLGIEAQDMVRIMQHINTEEHEEKRYGDIPENLDAFLVKLVIDDENELEVTGEDHVQILTSYILEGLANAVMEHIKSFDSVDDMNADGTQFIIDYLSETNEQIVTEDLDFNDAIFIKPISNGMYLIHISPIKAIKLFTKFYAKNTGINVFFDINTWDTNFMGDKDIINSIYKKIYKGSIGHNPYFTFGIILNIDDDNIVDFAEDKVVATSDNIKFKMFKDFELKNFFTERSFDIIRKQRVNESVVLRHINDEKDRNYESVISEFFFHFTRPISVDITDRTGTLPDGKGDLFKTDGNSFIVSRNARQIYQEKLEEIRVEFATTISLDYIVHTNFTSVRSVEYNSLLTNQMKSVPITQLIQLFLGAMTVIPVSQSRNTTGFDNTSHNISQRIWLSSAIGFSNAAGVESWILKDGLKPTIYFGLNYSPSYVESEDAVTEATYVSDADFINAEMYTLPDNGSLSIYGWSRANIHIGYSKFSDGEWNEQNETTPLSLGMTNVFDLLDVTGDIRHYISENIESQVGGTGTPIAFPRICAFKIKNRTEQNTHASTAIARFDAFNEIPKGSISDDHPAGVGVTPYSVYLGYDLYGMKGAGNLIIEINNNQDLALYAPMYDGVSASLVDIGSIVNIYTQATVKTERQTINPIWNDTEGDYPSVKKVKIGRGFDRKIVLGIQNFFDPTKLLPILRSYAHFIEHGFTGVNGEGDNNWYKSINSFQIYHNINFAEDSVFLTTFKLTGDEGTTRDAKVNTVKELIDGLIKWAEKFEGNIENKRLMMLMYATKYAGIRVSNLNGQGAPVNNVAGKVIFRPSSLMSRIEISNLTNPSAIESMEILVGVVRSLAHYMNRVAKESTTGGVLYMPMSIKSDGEIFKIGDAINFQKPEDIDVGKIEALLKKVTFVNNAKTDLDIYKKIYYIWKATYYFGGAGTDPSGTSGNTMRLYLTDSGIHWASSYEEGDITTKIAESMQLHRLTVGT